MSVGKIVVFVAITGLLMTTEGFLFSVPEPEIPIKLYRGNETSGVLMVYVNGVWGTVCDDMWDDEDARVVCRQLGLEGSTHVNRAPERFGIKIYADNNLRTKRILLTDVRCDGSEPSLFDCLYFNETITCDHDEDAGVICHPRQVSWGESTKRVAAPPAYTDSPIQQDKRADGDQNITGFTETSVLRTPEVGVNEWGNTRLESVSVAPSTGYTATRAASYPTDFQHVTSGVEWHLLDNLLYHVLFVTWVNI